MPTRSLLALAAAAAAAGVLTGVEQAAADPSISARRAEAARVLADVRRLDNRLELSVEAYDLARVRLAANARALTANARELQVARRNLSSAQRRIAARLVDLYVDDGPGTPLDVILGARSLGDLLDRIDAARRIADQDALVAREVRMFKGQVLRQQQALRREHDRRARLVADLSAQRRSIEAQLGERRRLLASIEGEIARLQAKERAQQAALRRQVEARLAAQRAARQTQAAPEPAPQFGASAVTPEGITVVADTRHAHVVPIALRYLGVPYLWGGASPQTGFDCSGFVMYVYAQVGISLPHNAALQYGYGVPVAKEDLEPGDIVFFNNLGHDGIYIGNGQFVQAPRTGDVVKISSLSEPWYSAMYVGARRLP